MTIYLAAALAAFVSEAVAIPLPEHPRPDWERAEWVNLNGEWDFAFEAKGTPVDAPARPAQFDQKIVVPFGWAAPLSGVKGEGDSAWYRREVEIPADWKSPRFFLVVGASDWQTDVFVNGKFVDQASGRIRSVRGGAHPLREEGRQGDCRTARMGRSGVNLRQGLAALRQTGLRQRARRLADRISRRARRKLYRVRAHHALFRDEPLRRPRPCQRHAGRTCESAARCHDRLQAGGRRR